MTSRHRPLPPLALAQPLVLSCRGRGWLRCQAHKADRTYFEALGKILCKPEVIKHIAQGLLEMGGMPSATAPQRRWWMCRAARRSHSKWRG